MVKFHLYRLKIEQSRQATLPYTENERPKDENFSDIILSAIEEKPYQKGRKGQTWRIGNIQKIEKQGVFFALGRITKATHGDYDEKNGNFIEKDESEALHTHVAIDLNLQICAIAEQSKIVSPIRTISKNFSKILNMSHEAKRKNIVFNLSEIPDPEEFLNLIKNAKRISKFEMILGRPNPADIVELIHETGEKFVLDANGSKASISVTSSKEGTLKKKVLENLTRSVSSTGNKVRARIQSENDEKPVTKTSGGNPLTVWIRLDSTQKSISNILEKIKETYNKLHDKEK